MCVINLQVYIYTYRPHYGHRHMCVNFFMYISSKAQVLDANVVHLVYIYNNLNKNICKS